MRHKHLLILVTLFCFYKPGLSFGQTGIIKPSLLGVHFFAVDFNTPEKIKKQNVGQLFNPTLKEMKPGLAFDYMKGLSKNFDLDITFSGCFIDYPIKNKPAFGANSLLLQTSAMTNLKLMSDQKFFTPFIGAGAGLSKYKNYYGVFLPVGLGLQFNFRNEVYVLVNSHYSFAITSNVSDNIYHSIGIAGNIKKRKQKRIAVLPKPQPVNLALQDRDGDGIMDSEDKCPTEPGLAKYSGCPVPDTDNDGMNDEEDKCPIIYGVRKYEGCPIPDTDGDGVNDENDSCITEAGPLNNKGCPVSDTVSVQAINTAAQQIFFETGKAKLLSASYKPLDAIGNILIDNPKYRIRIEGHTDSIGNKAANQVLSEARAKTVMEYLKSKGIELNRMQAVGFGQEKPIADNNTEKGRSKNRRVEIKVNP